jgi:hypothetical protein
MRVDGVCTSTCFCHDIVTHLRWSVVVDLHELEPHFHAAKVQVDSLLGMPDSRPNQCLRANSAQYNILGHVAMKLIPTNRFTCMHVRNLRNIHTGIHTYIQDIRTYVCAYPQLWRIIFAPNFLNIIHEHHNIACKLGKMLLPDHQAYHCHRHPLLRSMYLPAKNHLSGGMCAAKLGQELRRGKPDLAYDDSKRTLPDPNVSNTCNSG